MIRLFLAEEMPKKKRQVVGENMPDPFFDSYQEEVFLCCDIIDLMGKDEESFINVTFDKSFLKKIVKSHLYFVRELENKGL